MAKTARAKIFTNGGSQAVRLPKDFRFPKGQREVSIRRVGKKIILELADEPADEPAEGWTPRFLRSLGSWKGEIPRPPSEPISKAKNPFR